MVRRTTAAVDLSTRVDGMTVEAMECRDLLHAWPRPHIEAHKHLITFTVTAYAGGRAVAATRSMTCAAGCGVSKVQRYRITRDGRMERDGTAQYRYPDDGYRLRASEPGAYVEPVDRDALRYTLLTRLYPGLKW